MTVRPINGTLRGRDRCGPRSIHATKPLWRQAGLQVPRGRPRRRVATRRLRPQPPTARNHVWAYDFVFDTCADGRSLKCLTIVDEFTRECLAIDVAGSIRSERVIDVLGQLVSLHGAPRSLRSDNGPEFIATALLRWLQTAKIDTAFIDPGKPWQNGTDESFNGKFRNECLSLTPSPWSGSHLSKLSKFRGPPLSRGNIVATILSSGRVSRSKPATLIWRRRLSL